MQELHIVSFDIPFPADYGGVIDVFYKIKTLAALNIKITLHCFKYGSRKEDHILKKYCKEVHYYKRKTGIKGISTHLPYIVYSRRNKTLLQRLSKTNAPILFEGLHTCFYLDHNTLKNKLKIVRCHNIEHKYYSLLSDKERFLKKIYFKEESKRLKKFESILSKADIILPISQADFKHFSGNFKDKSIHKTTPFHSNEDVNIITGKSNYSLFHGSLSSIENEKSAFFLIKEIAPYVPNKLIIAGSNPSNSLIKACNKQHNTVLIKNPSDSQLEDLIKNAQIHLMYATQKSGLKLKLLKALHSGRHVIANNLMATEDDIVKSTYKANTLSEWIELILKLNNVHFTNTMIEKRAQQLTPYSNSNQATQLWNLINKHY